MSFRNVSRAGWRERPSTVLALVCLIVACMPSAHYWPGFIMLAGLAGFVLFAVFVTRVTAWRDLYFRGETDHVCPPFNRMQLFILGILLAVAVMFCIPIWHCHGDFIGRCHGHFIWEQQHIH